MASKRSRRALYGVLASFCSLLCAISIFSASAAEGPAVDIALILAVDVSNSVDEERYQLQMEGIAQALEDTSVADAITSGPEGGIVLSLVTWADHAEVLIPWRVVRTKKDAMDFASLVRQAPQISGEYTCTARMLEKVEETIIPDIPVRAVRTVVDVSGDGIDNCGEPEDSAARRDALAAKDVTINALPIIVKGENEIVVSGAYRAPGYELKELPYGPGTHTTTLDQWYKDNVMGGPFAFLIAANGFDDFGRAFRQKFVTEISLR